MEASSLGKKGPHWAEVERETSKGLDIWRRVAFQRGPYAAVDLGEGKGRLGPLGINVKLPTSSQTRSCHSCAALEINVCPVILLEYCAARRCFKCPHYPFTNSHPSGRLSVVHSFHIHRTMFELGAG